MSIIENIKCARGKNEKKKCGISWNISKIPFFTKRYNENTANDMFMWRFTYAPPPHSIAVRNYIIHV